MHRVRFLLFFLSSMSLCNTMEHKYAIEATEEIELIEQETQVTEYTSAETAVFATFLLVTQHLITAVQNPENPVMVTDSLTKTVANLVQTTVLILEQLPQQGSSDEKLQYIKKLENALLKAIQTIAT